MTSPSTILSRLGYWSPVATTGALGVLLPLASGSDLAWLQTPARLSRDPSECLELPPRLLNCSTIGMADGDNPFLLLQRRFWSLVQ